MPPPQYVIIAGNIGTGKTTAVQNVNVLVDKSIAFYEDRDIYLSKFYREPQKYAFLNQLAYSLQYLNQAVEISKQDTVVVQDRSIYDTHQVFSEMRLHDGMISKTEFQLLERIYAASKLIVNPTLMVMLDASVEVAYNRFLKRAEEQEKGLPRDLLIELREAYRAWYQEFDLCEKILIQTDQMEPSAVAKSIVTAIAAKG
jgi:deoxyadenosine/deoxycytidine kinase